MNKVCIKKNKIKVRKEFTKLNSLVKFALKKMYKKYGYDQSLILIVNMKEPTFNERNLMLNYIHELNDLNILNKLNNKAER